MIQVACAKYVKDKVFILHKVVPLPLWYYDLTLAMIIMQFKNNPNKRDIIECVKFYDDGEYEILYTEY